jgi:predicted HTH domain antitoxin
MEIALPAPFATSLTPSQAALHLAIGLYTSGDATLGQAAEVANLNQTQFLHELGRRKISLNYGREDFAQDLLTVEKLLHSR